MRPAMKPLLSSVLSKMADRAQLILDVSSPKEHPAQEARSRTLDHSIANARTVKQIPSCSSRYNLQDCKVERMKFSA